MHKILVVDHDIHTVRMLTATLEAEGYVVSSAENPEKALSIITEAPPSLVLLDLMSSERQSINALREMRLKHNDVDVVLMTGHHDDDLVLEMTSIGAATSIQKPFRRDELLKTIRHTLFVRSEYDKNISSTRILVVDDDKLILSMIKDALAGVGEIVLSCSPIEALRHMKARPFDILIADIHMPEMDGIELIKRANLIIPGLRTIVLTSHTDIQLARTAMRQGASDYITKPFESEEIRESILTLMDRKRKNAFDRFRQRLEKQEKHEEEQFEATLNMVEVLIMALEARDTYTRGHSERVTAHSVAIGKKMGLPKKEIEIIRHSARLHDIGKIGIIDDHLYKTERLTRDEMSEMKRHPVVGSNIMRPVEYMAAFIPGVRHHHERYDGKGYPDGLKGEEIPLQARIIAVADAFDAMTSSRPYKVGMDNNFAIKELNSNRGIQFDPAVVDAFLKCLKTENQ